MAIRVEFIRRRAGGRITVRPTIYERNEVTLGRATDCDVHLPDLRVGLHHARFIHLNADKVRVEASSDYQLRVNGASVRRRDVEVGGGTEIKIGPYRILLTGGETVGDLVITIELVDPVTTSADTALGRKALWKTAIVPPKRTTSWLVFTLIAAMFLALPIWSHFYLRDAASEQAGALTTASATAREAWLAGAMSSVHANLTEDCAVCHQKPFSRVGDDTCLGCHLDTRNHAAPERLDRADPGVSSGERWLVALRGTLGIPEGRCGSCHFEHGGPDGVTPTNSTMCVDCHRDMDMRLPDTALHDVSSFARRHPEFKPTLIVGRDGDKPTLARITLADWPKEDSGLEFSHAFHLNDDEVFRKVETLTGSAKARIGLALDCADCHKEDAAGQLFEPIEMETACADCHSLAFSADERGTVRLLPHGEPQEVRRVLEDFYLAQASGLLLDDGRNGVLDRPLAGEARARRERMRADAFANARASTEEMIGRIFSDDGLCLKCHESPLGSAAGQSATKVTPVVLSDQFLPKSRFNHAKHTTGNLDCADCHRAEESETTADVLLPGITTCRECHAGTTSGENGLSGCLTCHAFHDDATAPFMHPAKVRRADGGGIWTRRAGDTESGL